MKRFLFGLGFFRKEPKPIDHKILKEEIITICAELNARKIKLPSLAFELLDRMRALAQDYNLFGEVTSHDPKNGSPFVVKWFSGRRTVLELVGHHKSNMEMIPPLLEGDAEVKVWLHYGYEDLRESKRNLDPDDKIILASISYYLRYPDRWPSYVGQRRREVLREVDKSTTGFDDDNYIDRMTAVLPDTA